MSWRGLQIRVAHDALEVGDVGVEDLRVGAVQHQTATLSVAGVGTMTVYRSRFSCD